MCLKCNPLPYVCICNNAYVPFHQKLQHTVEQLNLSTLNVAKFKFFVYKISEAVIVSIGLLMQKKTEEVNMNTCRWL